MKKIAIIVLLCAAAAAAAYAWRADRTEKLRMVREAHEHLGESTADLVAGYDALYREFFPADATGSLLLKEETGERPVGEVFDSLLPENVPLLEKAQGVQEILVVLWSGSEQLPDLRGILQGAEVRGILQKYNDHAKQWNTIVKDVYRDWMAEKIEIDTGEMPYLRFDGTEEEGIVNL